MSEEKTGRTFDFVSGLAAVESRRRRDDDVMMPMMGEGMNPDVGPTHPGMMNKKHFPPGERTATTKFDIAKNC